MSHYLTCASEVDGERDECVSVCLCGHCVFVLQYCTDEQRYTVTAVNLSDSVILCQSLSPDSTHGFSRFEMLYIFYTTIQKV